MTELRATEQRFETEHYVLSTADEAAVRAWHGSWFRDENVMRFTGIDWRWSLEECLRWRASFDGKRGFLFTVQNKKAGEHVGLVRLLCDPRHGRATPITVLAERGGSGQEVMTPIYDFVFDVLGMNKILFLVWRVNRLAQIAFRQHGYTSDGVLRQQEFAEGLGWQDVRVFSLLASEWRARRGAGGK